MPNDLAVENHVRPPTDSPDAPAWRHRSAIPERYLQHRDQADRERQSLVLLAQAGDSRAVAELYEIYNDMVFRFIYFRVGNRQLSEDIASDTWVRALKRLGSYVDQGKDIGAWLITIARNLVADHFKSGRYRLEVTTGDVLDASDDRPSIGAEGDPAQCVTDHVTNLTLVAALQDLNEEQREVLVLRFLKGLSVAETARVMRKNEGAIKALQYRATASMRRHPDIQTLMASFSA